MSIYEIIMLLCFGAAWPVSIWKSWTSKSAKGKSRMFLIIIIIGYMAGVLHKIYYYMDNVIYLYALNLIMVSIDLVLVIRNEKLEANTGITDNSIK